MKIGILANVSRHFSASWPIIFETFEQAGFEVVLAAGDSSTIGERWEVKALRGVTRRPSFESLRGLRAVRKWARDEEVDMVITNTATPSAISRIGLLGNVPVVYFAHGLHWGMGDGVSAWPWKLGELALSFGTTAAVVLNEEDEAFLSKSRPGLPVTRLSYGLGVDTSLFPRERFDVSGRNELLRLLWVGEFIDRKRPFDALEVVETLIQQGKNVELTMCGEGPLIDVLRSEVYRRGLSASVLAPGRVPVLDYYRGSDMLIHTARWEGLPRVFLEALSVGVPVFSYPIKGATGLMGVNTSQGETPSLLAAAIESSIDQGQISDIPTVAELSSRAAGDALVAFIDELLQAQQGI